MMPVDYQPAGPPGATAWIGSERVRIDATPAEGPHDYVGVDAFTQRPALSIPTYEYSHPKNYLGALVATSLEHTKPQVLDAIAETVVSRPEPALRGAHAIHLIQYDDVGHPEPTPQGHLCLRHLARIHGSLPAARTAIQNWKGTQTRFRNLSPGYGLLSQTLLAADPALSYLYALLTATAPINSTNAHADTTLPVVAQRLLEEDVVFASAMFLRNTEAARHRVIGLDTDAAPLIKPAALHSPEVYRGTTTQQVKSILYHLGALTTPGNSTDRLRPDQDHWELDEFHPAI